MVGCLHLWSANTCKNYGSVHLLGCMCRWCSDSWASLVGDLYSCVSCMKCCKKAAESLLNACIYMTSLMQSALMPALIEEV